MRIKQHSSLSLLLLTLSLGVSAQVHAEDLTQARDALAKQDSDADTDKSLEEVFEAAEKNYSLLKQGDLGLNYSFDYSYFADQRLNLIIRPTLDDQGQPVGSSQILSANVSPSSSHGFTNSFSLEFGLLNNLTVSGRFAADC